jgi:hypothetical protein
MWKVLKVRRERKNPGASPSSLLVIAAIFSKVRDVLRRGYSHSTVFGSPSERLSRPLAAVHRR